MEIELPLLNWIFSRALVVLSSLIQFFSGTKTLCAEKQDIFKWVSDSSGREVRSLQQLWDIGPTCLGKYIEQLNSQDVTWWSLQDLARSTYAVPQVMTKRDTCAIHLNPVAERKFLQLLKRLKEALERSAGSDSSHRLRVSGDIIAKGVALSSAYTGLRGVFFVYSYRNQLEGIKIDMNGPGVTKVETRTRKGGLMVSYTASRAGKYTLEISKNNWFAPGSPFIVNIQDRPVGYKGSFGGTLWDMPDTDLSYNPPTPESNSPPNSLLWDGEHDSALKKKVNFPEPFPSRPIRKKKFQKVTSARSPPSSSPIISPFHQYSQSKQEVVELSQIAAAIILARRFTNRMQCRIPELRVERPSDAQELNLWSNVLSPSPSSLREITYVSPEGATFPISVNGRRDGTKKWMESRGETYDEWMCNPSHDTSRGNESFLQSLTRPIQEDRLSEGKKSSAPFPRSSQPNMVRPFNHGGTTPSSGGLPIQQNHVWTQSVSIGVNTDELWTDPKSASIAQPLTSSKGVQVGRSFLSFETRDNHSSSCNDPEIKPDDPQKSEPNKAGKRETMRDLMTSRTRKCDTFNSDDTSSSVTTNYSEKIIEMDLKVNYETIALTDDDDLSQSEARETKRYLSLNDTSYDVPSIADSNCSSFKTEEAIKPFSAGNYEKIENERENAHRSVDGIYKATLMSLDNSISVVDKSSDAKATDNGLTPVKIRIDQSNSLAPLSSPMMVRKNGASRKKTYESIVSADGHLLTIIVGDEMDVPCNDDGQLSTSYLSESLSSKTSNEHSEADRKKIDLKHFKYLTKRNWTNKISSRRLVKQRSGNCKRTLRKTLSLIPKFNDLRRRRDPSTSALYSFGVYAVKKDVVHIPTSVRAWKQFWDNIATTSETKARKDIVVKISDARGNESQPVLKTFPGRKSSLQESLRDEDRKRRFVTAKLHFSKLEKEKTFRPITSRKSYFDHVPVFPQKLIQQWDLKGLFDDFNRGLGKPGVANRLGVLASLYSVESHCSVGGFQSQYPHLPVLSSGESSPSSINAKSLEVNQCNSMRLISLENDAQKKKLMSLTTGMFEDADKDASMLLTSFEPDDMKKSPLKSGDTLECDNYIEGPLKSRCIVELSAPISRIIVAPIENMCPPKSEDILVPDIENGSPPKSERIVAPNIENMCPPKSEDIVVPDIENGSPPKSEHIVVPDVENVRNHKSEHIAVPNIENMCPPKSEDILVADIENGSPPKSEHIVVPNNENWSPPKSQYSVVPDIENGCPTKSEHIENVSHPKPDYNVFPDIENGSLAKCKMIVKPGILKETTSTEAMTLGLIPDTSTQQLPLESNIYPTGQNSITDDTLALPLLWSTQDILDDNLAMFANVWTQNADEHSLLEPNQNLYPLESSKVLTECPNQDALTDQLISLEPDFSDRPPSTHNADFPPYDLLILEPVHSSCSAGSGMNTEAEIQPHPNTSTLSPQRLNKTLNPEVNHNVQAITLTQDIIEHI